MKYFTTQTKGNLDSCTTTKAPCPSDSISVAIWHTHGGYMPGYDNENFSPADKNYAKYRGQDIYLATPNDLFKQYYEDIIQSFSDKNASQPAQYKPVYECL